MSVDVGSATGYLDLDISGFLEGLRSAQSEASASASKLETVGNKFVAVGDKISDVGKKMTTAITLPLAGAVTAVVKGYADMEQAIGGVETLFKGSASDVIANAETAYKRAGTSATDYMEQVTSFSASLLQSVGGDTKEAAKIADMAMVDMSDNANKFGTDIANIQNAYQGFAKQNYTMLDNLKLGYGGTKTEMERLLADAEKLTGIKYDISNLDDVYTAIHVIQEEMGVTGTTAFEATETISGSFGMAKAAVSDFLANLGKPGADMEQFKQNMVESIKVLVDNIKEVLATLWENIPLEGWQKNLLAAAAAAGPLLTVIGKITSGAGKLMLGFNSAKTAITGMQAAAAAAGTSIGAIAAPIAAVVAIIAVLVAAFVNLWKTNEEFRDKITAIWDRIKGMFEEFTQGIVDRLNALGFDFENFTEVLSALWNGFCELLAPLFEGVFTQVANILEGVLGILTGILDIFIGLFTGNWEQMWEGVKGVFTSVWDFIVNTFTNIGNTLKGLLDTILGWFGTSWEEAWTAIKDFFVGIWDGIVSFFTNIIESIKTAVSNFINSIVTFFQQLPTKIAEFITNAYNAVVTWATNMVAKAKEMGTNFLNAVVEFFTQLPYKIGLFIGTAIGNVIKWVTEMVAKAREMGTNFLQAVVDFFTQLPGKVLQFITSAFNNVQKWATDMANKAREMGTNFINNVVSFFTQLPGKVQQFISSALTNVANWVTNMVNKAREMGTNFINNVVSFMTQLPGKIKTYLDSAINNLVTWVSQMGQKGKEAITSLINNVIDGAKSIPSKMAEIGRNIVEGVWQGIKNAASWFTDQVKGFFSGIVDGVKGALGIESPSKVFAKEIGRWLPPGVAQGFKTAMPAAMRSIEKELNKGIDNIEADDVNVSATTSVSTFADTLKGIYENVALWFESVETRIATSVDNMTEKLAMFINAGQVMVNPDGSLGYVGFNGFARTNRGQQPAPSGGNNDNNGGGDTYNFYSNKSISEVEAARQLKKAKQDMAEGF